MPAIQPIPRNAPTTASEEATAVLALHNRSTESRTRSPRWSQAGANAGSIPGANAGSRVK